MNYPMQELAIIAPILFIVLMVAFPLIGVFAGWKRAAFWGGGNLLFYIIGLVVWTLAGGAIANAIRPLLESLMKQLEVEITDATIVSIAAPVFFLIVFLIGNLLLVINYYAWFKRVAKLKKADKDPNPSTKSKVANHVIGGIGLPLLMLPSSLTLTQAVFMTTTSANTRSNNAFVSGLYNFVTSISDKVNWFSYYSLHGARDFDAVFATITLMNEETAITYITTGGETISMDGPVIEVMEQLLTVGLGDIAYATANLEDITQTGPETIVKAVNEFVGHWNDLNDDENIKNSIESVLSSDNATVLVDQLVEQYIKDEDKIVISDTNFDDYVDNFEAIKNGYLQGQIEWVDSGGQKHTYLIEQMNQINTTTESFGNIENIIHKLVNSDGLTDPEDKKTLDNKLNELLKLVLNPVL